jgi:hypothetical protein
MRHDSLEKLEIHISRLLRGQPQTMDFLSSKAEMLGCLEELKSDLHDLEESNCAQTRELRVARMAVGVLTNSISPFREVEVVREVLDHSLMLLHADRAALFMYENGKFRIKCSRGGKGKFSNRYSSTVFNRVLSTGKFIWGAAPENHLKVTSDSLIKLGVKDFLCCPLEPESQSGALYFDRIGHGSPFTEDAVASAAAVTHLLGDCLARFRFGPGHRFPRLEKAVFESGPHTGDGSNESSTDSGLNAFPRLDEITEALKSDLESTGLRNYQIAELLGMSPSTFYRRWPGRKPD